MKKKDSQDDIVFESDNENMGPDFETKIKKIKSELKKCQEEKTEYLDGWQRAKADFVNFKKRNEEELKSFRKFANESLILDILPTIDNFEAALKDHGESDEIKKWKTGFEHIYKNLKKVLGNAGVIELNPLNEQFDPNIHESVATEVTEDKNKDNTIFEVVSKGYKIDNKILRSPQVKVWELK